MSSAVARLAERNDFQQIFELLGVLAGNDNVLAAESGQAHWEGLITHPGTSVFCAELNDRLVSTATLHILPNLTYLGRSYALVENVVTLPDHQGLGYGRLVMEAVTEAAWASDCYKIMLLSGKAAEALGFYERLGFSTDEKHGLSLRRVPPRLA